MYYSYNESTMKRLLIILLLSVCATPLLAQRRYAAFSSREYKSDTIRMDGYTYIKDTINNFKLEIYNAANQLGLPDLVDSNGEPIMELSEYITLPREQRVKIMTILDETFTDEMVASKGKSLLLVNIAFSTQDGSVTDVFFTTSLMEDWPYSKIPVEVYRAIELRLKSEIKAEISEKGRLLPYCDITVPYSRKPSKAPNAEQMTVPKSGEKGSAELP